MQLNIRKLKFDINEVAAELRRLKQTIRRTPLPWERNLWTDLREKKRRATLLCALRAHSRGKLHLHKSTKSHAYLGLPRKEVLTFVDQEKLTGEIWKEYELDEGASSEELHEIDRTIQAPGAG